MADEDAALKEMLKHLEEAASRIQASRHLLQENELVEDPNYLGLLARVSEALDMTEAARREARRRREQAERERDDLRRELFALRQQREAPETTSTGEDAGPPRPDARGPQEGAQRPWWRRMFGG